MRRTVRFVLGSNPPPELVHHVAGLADRLSAHGGVVGIDADMAVDLQAADRYLRVLEGDWDVVVYCETRRNFAGDGTAEVWELRYEPREEEQLALSLGPTTIRYPLAVTASTFPRAAPRSRPTILIEASEPGRRLRTARKVITELRRRETDCQICWYGVFDETPGEIDHHFETLSPGEYASLLGASTVLLETAERGEPAAASSRIAPDIGSSVVAHETSALSVPESNASSEWSADAFCDMLLRAFADPPPAPRPQRFEQLFETFVRTLHLA